MLAMWLALLLWSPVPGVPATPPPAKAAAAIELLLLLAPPPGTKGLALMLRVKGLALGLSLLAGFGFGG
jgi:hypothetical protein